MSSTSTNTNNRSAQKGKKEADPARDERVGKAYGQISGILKGLSNSEASEVLRAIAGANGLTVSFPGALVQQGAAAARSSKEKREGKPKSGSNPNPANKDPKVLAAKKELDDLNRQVKELSIKDGERLSPSHELMLKKKEVEERMRSFRAGVGSSKQA